MKKAISLLISFLLLFSFTIQAYAAGSNIDEEYLALDELSESLDHFDFPEGFTVILRARAYYDEEGNLTTERLFKGSADETASPELTASIDHAKPPVSTDFCFEQRTYYDLMLGTIVIERIYSGTGASENPPEETGSLTSVPSTGGEAWFENEEIAAEASAEKQQLIV